jgi:HEAT repeat protein
MASEDINNWIDQLNDPDWDTRQRAAEALRAQGPEAKDALEALRNRLSVDDDPDVRGSIVRAIESIERDKSVLIPELITFLENPNWEVRQQAAEALGALGPEAKDALTPLWTRISTDDDSDVRNSAVTAVAEIEKNKPNLVSKSVELLKADSFEGARAAVSVLGAIREFPSSERERTLDALWVAIKRRKEARFIEDAFAQIVALTPNTDDVTARLLEDNELSPWKKSHLVVNFEIRDSIYSRWITDTESVQPLILGSLGDEDPDTRGEAIEWLVQISDDLPPGSEDAVVEALWTCLRRHGEGLQALTSILGQAPIDQLMSDPEIAPGTVGRLVLTEARDALDEKWAIDEDREGVLKLILAALEHRDWGVRQAAADWLADRTEGVPHDSYDSVVSALEKRLRDDEDPDVRRSVDHALVRFKQRKRVNQTGPLLELFRTGDEDAQVDAIEKLVEMETREALRALIREWVQWIAYDDKALLVETAAEEMRGSRFAVLPLIDQLSQGTHQDPELANRIRDEVQYTIIPEDETTSEADLDKRIDLLVTEKLRDQEIKVHRRIAGQLADMSDDRFFHEEKNQKRYEAIKAELGRHAVPALARRLPQEPDFDIRESLARTLGNVGGREAVDALARAVVGEERTRTARQDLLAKYYLEPSKARGEEAASILRGAVIEAKRTLRLLQGLNIAVFAVGLFILVVGLFISITTDNMATRVAGALAGLGGFVGVIAQLIRQPLERIQNAMANLVQVETAFTSFIWELNLNGTYIQSKYVAKGELYDEDIKQTVDRIEGAMNLAMNLVAVYTEEGGQRLVTRINKLSPAAGEAGEVVTIHGQHLQGDGSQKKDRTGMIAVNHTPIEAEDVTWDEHEVKFRLPPEPPGLETGDDGTIWVSMFVDGLETNALPFHMAKKS